jgi:O-antigen ligase
MWSLFSEARTRQLSVFWSAVIIVGLFVTRWILVLPSIGMAGLFVASVGYALANRRIAQWAHARTLLSLTLVYWVHLFTGLAHNKLLDRELLQDLVLQLPFLLLPLSFLLLPTWRAAHKRVAWGVLMGCCLISALASTSNYLLHAQEIAGLYDRSQVMPTQPDHVRFSLLISIAILTGCTLLLREVATTWERFAIGIMIATLFLFQHLLAVRSGLLSLYVGGVLLLLGLGWQLKRWKTAAASIVAVLGFGFACVWLLPTLQLRINNTVYDTMQRGVASSANNFSVTARLYSYEVAETIICEHPILGVGKVQLKQEMAQQYSYKYPEINASKYLLPHNQFIYNLAAYGLIGLSLFLYGFYYPLWMGIRQHNLLVLVIYSIITVSFLTEYTLENNLGVIIGLFFSLLALAPVVEEVPVTCE